MKSRVVGSVWRGQLFCAPKNPGRCGESRGTMSWVVVHATDGEKELGGGGRKERGI